MKLLVWGLSWESDCAPYPNDYPFASAEDAARAEVVAQWGTDEDCLVVDVVGLVMLNTTGVEIEAVTAT